MARGADKPAFPDAVQTGRVTTSTQTLLTQLIDPAHRADPYPIYRQLRESGPALLPESNLSVFAEFADCDEVLRHPAS